MAESALFAISLLSTGVQFIAQRSAAKTARAEAKAQADQERVRLQGELIERKRRFIDQTKANIAASGASGVDPFSGTNALITEEGFRRFDLETLTAQTSSDNARNTIRARGNQAANVFNLGAAGSLLKAGAQIANRG